MNDKKNSKKTDKLSFTDKLLKSLDYLEFEILIAVQGKREKILEMYG